MEYDDESLSFKYEGDLFKSLDDHLLFIQSIMNANDYVSDIYVIQDRKIIKTILYCGN